MHEFWSQYEELLSDPAHTAVELTFTLVVDILVLGMLWPLMRKFIENRLRREHETLDREHGVSHNDASTPAASSSATLAETEDERNAKTTN